MKKSKSKTKVNQNIVRFKPKPDEGLTLSQVKKRTEDHLVNISNVKTNKTAYVINFGKFNL